MSTPKTHTIAIQFGHLVRLNEGTIKLVGVFSSAIVTWGAIPGGADMAQGLKAARAAISEPMISLGLEMLRQRVPSPLSIPKPPDNLVLHLPLPEPLLQQLADLVTSCAEAWQQLSTMIPGPLPAPVAALLDTYRKDSAEVAGYWLAAISDAGVPAAAK